MNNFFSSKTPKKYSTKKCFIYDSVEARAYFDYLAPPSSRFIISKEGLDLYHIPPIGIQSSDFPPVEFIVPPALLKSNLQKAIRRRLSEIAVTTALALLQSSPVEFIRRLGVIFIEDVCATPDMVLVVWLMVADKYYKLSSRDIWILLNVVHRLSREEGFLEDTIWETCKKTYTLAELLKTGNSSDCVLAIKLRQMYGGMKGDMNMLDNAVAYYLEHPIPSSQPMIFMDSKEVSLKLYIIDDAIDFHCYPNMLREIRAMTGYKYQEEDIKFCIWYTCSGINCRKSWTIENQKLWKNKPIYNAIISCVKDFRKKCISE